jgi:hypothetical protein
LYFCLNLKNIKMENVTEERELTHEELAARKEEMKQFYIESHPYLEAQAKYEKLLTEIEEARFKRATIQIQWANIMAAQQEQEGNESEEEEESAEQPSPTAERKLKKS